MAGLAAAFGSGAMTNSIAEIEDAGCIFVIGSNTTACHPLVARRILRAKDMPEVETILVEVPQPRAPYGVKGVGEIGLVPTAGAVAGALRAFAWTVDPFALTT